jgi:hypothetical protein
VVCLRPFLCWLVGLTTDHAQFWPMRECHWQSEQD